MDVRAGFENCNGSVGAVGEDHFIASILQFDVEYPPDQEFMLNDKDCNHLPTPLLSKVGSGQKFKQLEGFYNSPHWYGGRISRMELSSIRSEIKRREKLGWVPQVQPVETRIEI